MSYSCATLPCATHASALPAFICCTQNLSFSFVLMSLHSNIRTDYKVLICNAVVVTMLVIVLYGLPTSL